MAHVFQIRKDPQSPWIDVPALKGKDGKSAYEQAVEGGYSGSESDFIGMLNGLTNPYPVGSIYISVTETDPSTLFGGVWERLQGRFLLGASNQYKAGTTGGEATHKLTKEELPNHWHNIGERNNEGPYGPHWAIMTEYGEYNWSEENSGSVGSDQPHNNMPPYLAVYMWKRVR